VLLNGDGRIDRYQKVTPLSKKRARKNRVGKTYSEKFSARCRAWGCSHRSALIKGDSGTKGTG